MTNTPQNHKSLKAIIENYDTPSSGWSVKTASGGHMAYDHLLISNSTDKIFAKVHDSSLFTDQVRERHSRLYLEKEQSYFEHLRAHGFSKIPNRTELINDEILAMDALTAEDGWHWRIPDIDSDKYISDVLSALDQLSQIPLPENNFHELVKPTYDTIHLEGWDIIDDIKKQEIRARVLLFKDQLNDNSRAVVSEFLNNLDNMHEKINKIKKTNDLVLSHNDARQSNIAWHPNMGVRIIDWSWADAAPKKADSTMFLIDLAKTGYDVTTYLTNNFNKDFALMMIGFWLAHSLLPTHDGNTNVRMHQVASAITAFSLIKIFNL